MVVYQWTLGRPSNPEAPTATPTTVPSSGPSATPTNTPTNWPNSHGLRQHHSSTNTAVPSATPTQSMTNGIKVHYKGFTSPNVYAWKGHQHRFAWRFGLGQAMTAESNGWYVDSFPTETAISLIFNGGGGQTPDLTRTTGEWWYTNGVWTAFNPEDLVPPSVTIISPAAGPVSGIVPITVNAK
jgi:hypothetical protein